MMKMSHYFYVMTLGFGLITNVTMIVAMKDGEKEITSPVAMTSETISEIKEFISTCQARGISREQTLTLLKKQYNAVLVDDIDALALALEKKHGYLYSCCYITGGIALFLTGGLAGAIWIVSQVMPHNCSIQ